MHRENQRSSGSLTFSVSDEQIDDFIEIMKYLWKIYVRLPRLFFRLPLLLGEESKPYLGKLESLEEEKEKQPRKEDEAVV